MDPWVWPAYVGVLLGTSALLLLLVPILAYQYRRYGQFTPRRALGAAAVSVYGASLLAYTFLPLPDSRGDWCATASASPQWRPFQFITDIADAAAGTGPLQLLSSRVTLQVLFNVVLFVPWGLMVRGFWGRSAAFAAWSGLLASVVIESTQLTGVWGIYHCAYRVGDVDDLITNGLGALVGAVLAPWVLWWMPRPRSFDDTRQLPRPVTSGRRWLGMALDLAAFNALGLALVVSYRLAALATTGRLPSTHPLVEAALITLVPALCVFVLPAWHGTGASLGQRAARLEPVWDHGPSTSRRLLRAMSVAGTYSLTQFYARWQPESVGATAAQVAGTLLLVAAFVAVPLTRQRGLSGVLTGARFEDERTAMPGPSGTPDGVARGHRPAGPRGR